MALSVQSAPCVHAIHFPETTQEQALSSIAGLRSATSPAPYFRKAGIPPSTFGERGAKQQRLFCCYAGLCVTGDATLVRMRASVKRWIVVGACLAGLAVIAIALPCIIPAPDNQVEARAKAGIRAEETNLVHNAIAAYFDDRGHQPKCLDELVTSGYLKAIPKDFLAKAKDFGLTEHCE
jgi:competence protein ComGC